MTHLVSSTRVTCRNQVVLHEKGHPKWREVDLSLPPLGPGWTYYGPTTKELRACAAKMKPQAPAKACSAEERILGFCK